jgi:uncharacterized repeat protein (TIGR01451 family)
MTISKVLLAVGVTSIIAVGAIAQTSLAWHPEGKIVKKVQNVTGGSALADADTDATAVAAKPGDTLKYVITISNPAKPAEKNWNDLAYIKMTDTLPAGIELVSDPAKRTITESLGTLKPGQSVTKEYLVKVTSKTNGTIKNTACFTGDSEVKDNPKQGCNPAVVKVTVPPVTPPVTPETPEVPETPVTETETELPAELPKTGPAETLLGSILAIGAVTYAVNHYVSSKRKLTASLYR